MSYIQKTVCSAAPFIFASDGVQTRSGLTTIDAEDSSTDECLQSRFPRPNPPALEPTNSLLEYPERIHDIPVRKPAIRYNQHGLSCIEGGNPVGTISMSTRNTKPFRTIRTQVVRTQPLSSTNPSLVADVPTPVPVVSTVDIPASTPLHPDHNASTTDIPTPNFQVGGSSGSASPTRTASTPLHNTRRTPTYASLPQPSVPSTPTE